MFTLIHVDDKGRSVYLVFVIDVGVLEIGVAIELKPTLDRKLRNDR